MALRDLEAGNVVLRDGGRGTVGERRRTGTACVDVDGDVGEAIAGADQPRWSRRFSLAGLAWLAGTAWIRRSERRNGRHEECPHDHENGDPHLHVQLLFGSCLPRVAIRARDGNGLLVELQHVGAFKGRRTAVSPSAAAPISQCRTGSAERIDTNPWSST